jgi:hypothetical protein
VAGVRHEPSGRCLCVVTWEYDVYTTLGPLVGSGHCERSRSGSRRDAFGYSSATGLSALIRSQQITPIT